MFILNTTTKTDWHFHFSVVKDVHRQILLFTCTDKPHEDQELRAQAERRAADLNDSNIEIHLLPIGNSFDINKFYKVNIHYC